MIPKDPVMLMSYINTQLRDNYSSFNDLCSSLNLNSDDIKEKLEKIGYIYNNELNKFVNK